MLNKSKFKSSANEQDLYPHSPFRKRILRSFASTKNLKQNYSLNSNFIQAKIEKAKLKKKSKINLIKNSKI